MKKILLPFFLFAFIFLGGHTAFAQTAQGSVPPGGNCSSDLDCQDIGSQQYGCYQGMCTVDGEAPADGTVAPGDPCTNDNSCEDVGGQNYVCVVGICTLSTATATGTGNPGSASGTPASSTAAAATGGAAGTGNFIPLTNLPIFGNSASLTSAPTLPAFFNALYVYCVGIAAVLAVLQLIHAGILYMGGDSITEVKQAKDLIGSAIFGLLLVLSPVIIFTLINPKILSLNVGFNNLGTTTTTSSTTQPTIGSQSTLTTTPTGAPSCTTTIANGASVPDANSQACCNAQKGCAVTLQIPPGGTILSNNSATCTCGS